MNEPPTQPSDAAAAARQQTLHRQQPWSALVFALVTVAALFLLPQILTPPYDVLSMGVGSAAALTVLVCLYPDSFRNRGGSLATAFCLVAALWLLAFVAAIVSIIGSTNGAH